MNGFTMDIFFLLNFTVEQLKYLSAQAEAWSPREDCGAIELSACSEWSLLSWKRCGADEVPKCPG